MIFKNILPKLFLIMIMIVAMFLRVYNLEYMEFKGDEGFNSLKALNLAEGKEFPLTSSIGSTGIHEPGIFMYILTIPYLFTKNPIIAAWFIAMINVLGIFVLYIALKKLHNKKIALIAIAFYAVNPWQVMFSRKIWTQDLVVPFLIFFIYFIFNAVFHKKKSHIIYAMALLGIAVQLHLSAAYFSLVALIMVIKYWKEIDKKFFVIGVILFLLAFLPYAIFQAKNNFVDVKTALDVVKLSAKFQFSAFTLHFRLISTNGFDHLLGSDFQEFKKSEWISRLADHLSMLILLASFIFLLFNKTKIRFTAAAWILTGTLFMFFNKVGLDTHYFLSFFPLYFILIGQMLGFFIDKKKKIISYFVCFAILVLLLYQFLFSLSLVNFFSHKECIHGEYGMPYLYHLQNIKKVTVNIDSQAIKSKFDDINKLSCDCVKCDLQSAEFIVRYLRSDYN